MRVAILDDHRCLVSMLGEAQGPQPAHAGTAELVVGGSVEPIRAREIHGEQKGAFPRQYFQQSELRARYALNPVNLLKNDQAEALVLGLGRRTPAGNAPARRSMS